MKVNQYVVESINLHLFFCRIMKEHALFLQAGFTPADPAFSAKAGQYLEEFDKLLSEVVGLADGVAGKAILDSGEVVTAFTAPAEKQTAVFTGIPINSELTARTLALRPGDGRGNVAGLHNRVHRLNRTAISLLDGLIRFKETVLRSVLAGELFTLNYPLLIEHIIREAKLYRDYLGKLEREGHLSDRCLKETECFWNQIMMEHALFLRGLLDPSETELIGTAGDFAQTYSALLTACRKAQNQTLTEKTLSQTIAFRDFKSAGTQGILQARIRGIILPLLADHVLREANHYIRLLRC